MADRLDMSLDSIITSARSKRDPRGGGNNRSNNGSRNNNKEGVIKSTKRVIDKVTTQRRQSRSPSQQSSSHGLISVKFLISNRLAGSIIGAGGASIRELVDVSKARLSVASKEEPYPGTNDRVLLITGKPNEVIFAASLIWQCMAIHVADEENGRRTVWSPRKSSRDTQGARDDTQISGRVTIPASAAGLIIGRAGANIRYVTEESGATLSVNGKEEAEEDGTNERIMSIGGSKQSCCECLTMIIEKLAEGGEASQYDDNHHMDQSDQSNDNSRRGSSNGSPVRGSRSKNSDQYDNHDPRKVITINQNNSGESNWLRGLEFEGNDRNGRSGRSLSSSMNFSVDSNHSSNASGRSSRRDSMDYDEDLREPEYSRYIHIYM